MFGPQYVRTHIPTMKKNRTRPRTLTRSVLEQFQGGERESRSKTIFVFFFFFFQTSELICIYMRLLGEKIDSGVNVKKC